MRVLVAEDVRRLADDIAEGLRDQGIAADIAYDGADAAVKLDLNPYDVLVLDRDLPGIHGDTLCRTITEAGHPVMVLMLTASGTPGDRVTGLALGADDYLPKPFHFPELVLRIRALARRKPAAQPRILRATGIELDPLRRTVTRDGYPVDVSVKEFAVLETLLRAAPAVLSAETSSPRPGTRTPTRSPRPSRSPSACSAANSATHRSSRPSPASATGSQTQITCQARNTNGRLRGSSTPGIEETTQAGAIAVITILRLAGGNVHGRRPALPRPATQPIPGDDHELLIDFAEALGSGPPEDGCYPRPIFETFTRTSI